MGNRRAERLRPRAGSADPLLLLEVVLLLVLFGLAVALFWIPVSEPPFVPGWWTGLLLAALFFGVLLLDAYRRRRHRHADLREEIRRDAAELKRRPERPHEESRDPQ